MESRNGYISWLLRLLAVGLGVSICKDIIDFHHGKIEVKSKTGEVSTFIVTLPKKP